MKGLADLSSSLRHHEKANRHRLYSEISFISEKIDRRTGEHFQWSAVVDKEETEKFVADALARWPGVKIGSIEPYKER